MVGYQKLILKASDAVIDITHKCLETKKKLE